jgi:ribokinase
MTVFDVVGFGALNVDKLFRVNCIAGVDEESFVKTHEESCGGSAANAIVGLARLGCKVGFVGKVAGDREGNLLLDDFRRESVDTKGVVRSKLGESGSVMGFVDKQGERALYIDSGVNDTIALNEIDPKYVSQAKFLHLTSFVGDRSFKTQKKLLEMLPETVKVSFDPGALYARRGLSQLEPIVKRTYVMMPNRSELELMTGTDEYVKGADFLIAKGVKVVAVKMGTEGSYVTNGRERFHVDSFKVKTVDTTGAGDAYCAGFLYGLLSNRGLGECGRLGNYVASRKVLKMGARANLPYAKDLQLLGKMVK